MRFVGSALVFYGLYMLWYALHGFFAGFLFAIPLLGLGGWILKNAKIRQQIVIDADAALASNIAKSAAAEDTDSSGNVTEGSNGQVFLYLRPFDSTNAFRVNPYRRQIFSTDPLEATGFDDIERYVATALRPLGSFVALGKPGEHWGAGRILVDEAQWQAEVLALARVAKLIVLLPSHRPGTQWEITKLQELQYLNKTIFIMPPLDDYIYKSDGIDVADEWKKTQEECKTHGLSLPDAVFGGAIFRYSNNELQLKQPLPIHNSRHWRTDLKKLCPDLLP